LRCGLIEIARLRRSLGDLPVTAVGRTGGGPARRPVRTRLAYHVYGRARTGAGDPGLALLGWGGARPRKEKAKLEQELAKARFVVEVQAKLQALLETISESADTEPGSSS
jgi:hypothetical protein